MRNVLALFLIAVIMLPLSGCITGTPPSATPAPTATPTATLMPVISISGVVLDTRGATVPDARVALWQGDQLVTTPENIQYTNSIGQFNFTNLQPAHYQVTADIPGLKGYQGVVDRRFDDSAFIEVVIPNYTIAGVTAVPSQSPTPEGMPRFEVTRIDPTTVQVRLTSFGGVTSLRGFYVEKPYITTPELVAVDKSLGESWSATIMDPNMKAPVHFEASSWVNGNYAVVIDTTV